MAERYQCPWCSAELTCTTELMDIHPPQEFPSQWEVRVFTCPRHGELIRADPEDVQRFIRLGCIRVIHEQESTSET